MAALRVGSGNERVCFRSLIPRTIQHKFPDASNDVYATCIARLVFYRFINPAIMCVLPDKSRLATHLLALSTPETFDIVSHTIDIAARKNLAQISRVITQITTGALFGEENPCYVPINDFVGEAIQELTAWLVEGKLQHLYIKGTRLLTLSYSC